MNSTVVSFTVWDWCGEGRRVTSPYDFEDKFTEARENSTSKMMIVQAEAAEFEVQHPHANSGKVVCAAEGQGPLGLACQLIYSSQQVPSSETKRISKSKVGLQGG